MSLLDSKGLDPGRRDNESDENSDDFTDRATDRVVERVMAVLEREARDLLADTMLARIARARVSAATARVPDRSGVLRLPDDTARSVERQAIELLDTLPDDVIGRLFRALLRL